jgi:hypothetical protein
MVVQSDQLASGRRKRQEISPFSDFTTGGTLSRMADRYAPHRSIASILAIILAIASFFVHSGIIGLVMAIIAIVLGLIGFTMSILPGTRGGVTSMLAVVLGLIGAICGVIRAIMHFGHHL